MILKNKPIAIILLLLAVAVSGCGVEATLAPPAPPTRQGVEAPQTAPDENSVIEPTAAPTATPLPPTETPIPPTATPIPTEPPTATPVPPTATPEPETVAIGSAEAGEILFNEGVSGSAACITCHYVDQDVILVGPSLQGIANRAGEQVEGQSAAEYLAESIIAPNAFLVPDEEGRVYSAGGMSLMDQTYVDTLTEENINDLVAYLLTLE